MTRIRRWGAVAAGVLAATTAAGPARAAGQANGLSRRPSISADGRYVAFESRATNLVSGDTNRVYDVFVRDRVSGRTTRVSVSSAERQGNRMSFIPSISGDGRFVAFASAASNLVSGDTNTCSGHDVLGTCPDVFVRDRANGTTTRVSISSSEHQANNWTQRTAISGTGRYVAFETMASNLVSGDVNRRWDVLVRDRGQGITRRASLSSDEEPADHGATNPAISSNGRYVAFESASTNLVLDDTNVCPSGPPGSCLDVFVRDRVAGTTERSSVSSFETEGNARSFGPDLSDDGRYVAFFSYATNLIQSDTNGGWDVFVRDRQAGATEAVSVASGGAEQSGQSDSMLFTLSMSGDGRYVAFTSNATTLVPDDRNGTWDVFVHDRATNETERISVSSSEAEGDGHSFYPSISADGRYVAFTSAANNLISGDSNGTWDVFVRDRQAGTTTRVSVR